MSFEFSRDITIQRQAEPNFVHLCLFLDNVLIEKLLIDISSYFNINITNNIEKVKEIYFDFQYYLVRKKF